MASLYIVSPPGSLLKKLILQDNGFFVKFEVKKDLSEILLYARMALLLRIFCWIVGYSIALAQVAVVDTSVARCMTVCRHMR